eukprot:4822236-Amphidinium_carterae.1
MQLLCVQPDARPVQQRNQLKHRRDWMHNIFGTVDGLPMGFEESDFCADVMRSQAIASNGNIGMC